MFVDSVFTPLQSEIHTRHAYSHAALGRPGPGKSSRPKPKSPHGRARVRTRRPLRHQATTSTSGRRPVRARPRESASGRLSRASSPATASRSHHVHVVSGRGGRVRALGSRCMCRVARAGRRGHGEGVCSRASPERVQAARTDMGQRAPRLRMANFSVQPSCSETMSAPDVTNAPRGSRLYLCDLRQPAGRLVALETGCRRVPREACAPQRHSSMTACSPTMRSSQLHGGAYPLAGSADSRGVRRVPRRGRCTPTKAICGRNSLYCVCATQCVGGCQVVFTL